MAEGDLALAIPGLLWIFFLCFLISLLLSAAALAGVTMGAATSAVAYMVSVKSLIANLLNVPLPMWLAIRRPSGVTPRRNKHSRAHTH